MSCYRLLLVPILIVLSAVGAGPAEENGSSSLPPHEDQLKDLRGVGVLVGRAEPWSKVERAWRSFLEKFEGVDLKAAVEYVSREALLEAARNAGLSKKRLDQLTLLKGAIIEELSRVRVVLADARQRKTRIMINRNEFEVTQSEPFRVLRRPGRALSFESEVEQYVGELESRLKSVDNEVRRANAELNAMTQRHQDVIQSLPETEKKLLEIGKKVK